MSLKADGASDSTGLPLVFLLLTRTLTHRQTYRQHSPLCPLTMGICPSLGWADLWMKPFTFRSAVVGTEEAWVRFIMCSVLISEHWCAPVTST